MSQLADDMAEDGVFDDAYFDDPGPPKCACGWPLVPCPSEDGWVPALRFPSKGAIPQAGDACPRREK